MMYMKPGSILLNVTTVLMYGLIAFSSVAQECDDARAAATDSSRFDVNDDGTVTDIDTGLTWQRCAIGQQWNCSNCTGKASLLTWDEAIHLPVSVNHKPGNDKIWRLPKINELAGFVDIRCKSPRIDLDLFPKTSAKPFWTTNNVSGSQEKAYTLSFGREGVSRTPKSEKHYVRLVHGRD